MNLGPATEHEAGEPVTRSSPRSAISVEEVPYLSSASSPNSTSYMVLVGEQLIICILQDRKPEPS